MKRMCKQGIGVLCAVLLTAQVIQASPAVRTDFGPSATVYDFTGQTTGTTVVTSGNLTVRDGEVSSQEWPGAVSPSYFDAFDSTPIRLDFSSPISAVGMDFIVNHQDTTLTLYNVADTAIESYTLPQAGLPTYFGVPYGFIGIDYGSNAISYAIIDTPLLGNELYIDNIIYQTTGGPTPATVPVPGAIVLGLIGTSLVAAIRRNKGI